MLNVRVLYQSQSASQSVSLLRSFKNIGTFSVTYTSLNEFMFWACLSQYEKVKHFVQGDVILPLRAFRTKCLG